MKNLVTFLVLYAVVATMMSTQIIDPVTPQRGKEVWTYTIPDWDFNDAANIKIQYSGNWVHMKPGGSYPDIWKPDGGGTAKYEFWGFGIAVYTELMNHHAGYIIDIDGVKDTIRTQDNRDLKDQLTYLNQDLPYGNHTVTFSSLRTDSTFVINKLIKWVDASPVEPKPCPDSLVIVYKDSITYKDSTVLTYDTISVIKEVIVYKEVPVYKDSTIFNYKDSTILVYDTISCPPVVVCPDPKPCPPVTGGIPTWIWTTIGVMMTTIVLLIIFYRTKKEFD